jgi:hypothetical protein
MIVSAACEPGSLTTTIGFSIPPAFSMSCAAWASKRALISWRSCGIQVSR